MNTLFKILGWSGSLFFVVMAIVGLATGGFVSLGLFLMALSLAPRLELNWKQRLGFFVLPSILSAFSPVDHPTWYQWIILVFAYAYLPAAHLIGIHDKKEEKKP